VAVHPNGPYVELLVLIGDLELGQSFKHHIYNTNATYFAVLHDVVGRAELDALLLDERSSFCGRVFIAITLRRMATQMFVLVEAIENLSPKYISFLLGIVN
jgi:hypothetical protein